MVNKEPEDIKNKQTGLNNTITELKNILEGVDSRINEAEKWITELEDRIAEITAMKQNKDKEWKETRTV